MKIGLAWAAPSTPLTIHFAQLIRVLEHVAELLLKKLRLLRAQLQAGQLRDARDIEIGSGHGQEFAKSARLTTQKAAALETQMAHQPEHRGRERDHEHEKNDPAFAPFLAQRTAAPAD